MLLCESCVKKRLTGHFNATATVSRGLFDFHARAEDLFDGDFEDAFELVEGDGRMAGKVGLDGSFNVLIESSPR
jgi:hypothetical protein